MHPNQKSICVFCGSRAGIDPAYRAATVQFGAEFGPQNWRLVYGAGDVGLMGTVADAAIDSGADTLGVIPTHLLDREVGKTNLSRFIITENMHERKKVMFMNSDAIMVLPGGGGSLDEFFEVLTWRQLGLHDKPIFVMNINGYWDPLISLIDQVIDQGFADASLKSFVTVVTDVPSAIAAINAS